MVLLGTVLCGCLDLLVVVEVVVRLKTKLRIPGSHLATELHPSPVR